MQTHTNATTKPRVLLRLPDRTPQGMTARPAGMSDTKTAAIGGQAVASRSWFSNPLVLVGCLALALAFIAFIARDRGPEVEAKNPQPEKPIQGLKMVVPAEEPVAMPTPPVQPIEPLASDTQAAPTGPETAAGPPIERLPQTGSTEQAAPPSSFSEGPALSDTSSTGDTSDLFKDELLRPGVARLENRIGKPTQSASHDQSRPGLY